MTITNDTIIAAARGWLGTPYRHQASCRGAGSDCLGLVRGVYRDLYGHEPETPPAYTMDWAEAGGEETLAAAARRHLIEKPLRARAPGDVLLFRMMPGAPAKHAGIALSERRMIHAYAGRAVCETSLSPWWLRRLAFVFAFPSSVSSNKEGR